MARRYRPAPEAAPEAAPEVLVEAGAAYEALKGLAMIVGDEDESSYLVGPEWFEQTRARMSPALRTTVRRLTGGHGALITHLAGLVHDAGATRRLAATLPLDRLVPRVTHGIAWTPVPEIRTVVLVPTLICRPWVCCAEHDDTMVFCYPATDRPAEAGPDSPEAVAATVYRALADYAGLANSTVHTHLMLLRNAGLVQVGMTGGKDYHVAPEVPDLGGLLGGVLRLTEPDVPTLNIGTQRRRGGT
ncbi:MAG: hypothetical protein E6J14_09120 [Chloroflexi bacterium]|nr:MAG: hypothetical protein E6J14_09120 [Chloroflexota bacterium]